MRPGMRRAVQAMDSVEVDGIPGDDPSPAPQLDVVRRMCFIMKSPSDLEGLNVPCQNL